MSVSLSKITNNGKAMYLAYDQGLEHGPTFEFNDKNVDPLYIIDIAKKGNFNGVIFHKGIAEKYNKEIKKSKVPLIIKLNGKTNLFKGEPYSNQICSVEEAIKLGAKAVGYTIYLGSKLESKMIENFSKIEKEAHSKKIPVIAWMYIRGKSIKNETSKEMISYAARVGLEINADIVKLKVGTNTKAISWAAKSAGRTKIVCAGGAKKDEKVLIQQVKEIMNSGASGLAIGRNIWKSKNPIKLSEKLRKIIFK